jgi:hypothetical protein
MTLTGEQLLIIGLCITGILVVCGFMKLLRSDRTLIVLTILTIPIGVFGLYLRGDNTEMVNGNGSTYMISPFVYVTSFALLRMLFKSIYKMEPTYERFSWFDAEEGRKQNWLDVTVHIVPMLLSFVVPILIDKIIK